MMKIVSRGLFPNLDTIRIENITQSEIQEINRLSFFNLHIKSLTFEGGVIDDLFVRTFDRLEELVIKNVKLATFPNLVRLDDLKTVVINDCGLTLTDESIVSYPLVSYIQLDLRNNNIQSLKPFDGVGILYDLNLEGNPIRDDAE